MSEYTSKPQTEQAVQLYDINGKLTNKLTNTVAKLATNGENTSFYIRVEGLSPVHHESFKENGPLLNPNLIKVDRECFIDYLNYLNSKKEGSYTLVKNAVRVKGFV